MYERFSDRARKVMQLANATACAMNHEYVGTEHVFIAILKDERCMATTILKAIGVDPINARLEFEKTIQPGPDIITVGVLPQSQKVKKAIELAMRYAHEFKSDLVSTEHLLLGLIQEGTGRASEAIRGLGVKLDAAKEFIDFLNRIDSADDLPDGEY